MEEKDEEDFIILINGNFVFYKAHLVSFHVSHYEFMTFIFT